MKYISLYYSGRDELNQFIQFPLNVEVEKQLVQSFTGESAFKYVQSASAATFDPSFTETCTASSLLINKVASNHAHLGLLPKDKRRVKEIKKYFNTYQFESMAFVCFHVVSSVGYREFKSVKSDWLKKALGNDYLLFLEQGRLCGLIDWKQTPTCYYSEDNLSYYHMISVKGRRGSFERIRLSNKISVDRIDRIKYREVSARDGAVLLKTYASLCNTVIEDQNWDVTNEALRLGHFIPSQDKFGRRCYNYFINKKKTFRTKIKYNRDSTAVTGELDLANSHAFFLFHLFHHRYLIDYACTDSKTRIRLKKAFDIQHNKWVMNKALTSLKCGRFLEDFFIPMMDECDSYWRGSTKKMMIATKKMKEHDMVDDRTLGKMAFMYIINDGMKHLLKKIADVPIYSFFAYTIVELQSITIAPVDIRGVKKYEPRKNTSLILQRIESRFMQETYLRSGISWGFLIHDSVFTVESEFDLVRKAMDGVARWMNIPTPFSKSKTYS